MAQKKDGGVCRFCLKEYAGSSIGRHLLTCKAKQVKDKQEIRPNGRIYHLKISGGGPFWLHIEANSSTTLYELDQFLRNIWLECCGHLSMFKIRGVFYNIDGEDNEDFDFPAFRQFDQKSMNYRLDKVLKLKDKFEHEYDFGSTTRLTGQVYAIHEGKLKQGIRILARNELPEFKCFSCDTRATLMCQECLEFFCDNCLEKHRCGDEMCSVIVNSPRMGVCGYNGLQDKDNFKINKM